MKFAECVAALLSETRVSARVAMGLKVFCSETSRCDPSESVTRRFSESVIRVGVWSELSVEMCSDVEKRSCAEESVMRNGIATPAKVRSEWECGLKWKCDPSENVIRNGSVILVEV